MESELTEKIIGCAYEVFKELGSGYLEKVYENAMMVELAKRGLSAVQQAQIDVSYKNVVVGEFVADLLIEDKVIVELKAVQSISSVHEVQLVNYLKSTGKEIGLLINFGDDISIRRRVLQRPENRQIYR
jgi:GxxExxY protein